MADTNKGQQQMAKVLRIGVVQGGKVIHEQLIKPGEGVTVGESPKKYRRLRAPWAAQTARAV
jgi:hypothetical protein